MCGGGGGDGGASEARRQERERQRKINASINRINRVFNGFTEGRGRVTNPANFSAGDVVYDKQGRPLEVVGKRSFGFANQNGKSPGGGAVLEVKNPNGQVVPRADVFKRRFESPGFDDEFFEQREQDFVDFATPQLMDQFEDQKDNLLFSLARNGRLESSTRSEKFGDLQKDLDIEKVRIADKARGVANQTRNEIERARSNLVNQATTLQNPALSANLAQQRISTFREQPQFNPIGNVFQNSTAGLATAVDADRRRQRLRNTLSAFPINKSPSSTEKVIG